MVTAGIVTARKRRRPTPVTTTRPSDTPPERRHEKRQRVHDMLRDLLLAREWPPGFRLNQNELAARLGTSVTSIREALMEMQFAGFVDKHDGVGFVVTKLGYEEFLDAWELYNLLQVFALGLCCRSASPNDLDALKDLSKQILAFSQSGGVQDLREVALLDRRFHDQITLIAGSKTLSRVVGAYAGLVPLLYIDTATEVGLKKIRRRAQESCGEHLAIVEAIERHRPDDAERLMREHHTNNMRCFHEEWKDRGNLAVQWHCRPIDIGGTAVMAISFDSKTESNE